MIRRQSFSISRHLRLYSVLSKGCVLENGWCFFSWSFKGITNKMPWLWIPPKGKSWEKVCIFTVLWRWSNHILWQSLSKRNASFLIFLVDYRPSFFWFSGRSETRLGHTCALQRCCHPEEKSWKLPCNHWAVLWNPTLLLFGLEDVEIPFLSRHSTVRDEMHTIIGEPANGPCFANSVKIFLNPLFCSS